MAPAVFGSGLRGEQTDSGRAQRHRNEKSHWHLALKWHPGGIRFSRRNLLVPLFGPSICATGHTLPLPLGISSKASMSPCTDILGLPQKAPPMVDSKDRKCGLSLFQRPEASKDWEGKIANGNAQQDPPTSSYFCRPWVSAYGTSASTIIWPLSVSQGLVSSPDIGIAVPGYPTPV